MSRWRLWPLLLLIPGVLVFTLGCSRPSSLKDDPRIIRLEEQLGFKVLLPSRLPRDLEFFGAEIEALQVNDIKREIAVLTFRSKNGAPKGELTVRQGRDWALMLELPTEELTVNGRKALYKETIEADRIRRNILLTIDAVLVVLESSNLTREDLIEVAKSI